MASTMHHGANLGPHAPGGSCQHRITNRWSSGPSAVESRSCDGPARPTRGTLRSGDRGALTVSRTIPSPVVEAGARNARAPGTRAGLGAGPVSWGLGASPIS